jgi:hypothetical protein
MRKQPVFAVVSGVGRGVWEPIHDFCEHREVPCLFPNTDRPPSGAGFYSLYLSRGISLEADLVTHEIARTRGGGERTVTQVFRDSQDGRARAGELRRSLAQVPGVRLVDRPLPAGANLRARSWDALGADGKTDLVLWLADADIAAISAGAGPPRNGSVIYLSSAMLGGPDRVPSTWRPATRLIHPFDLPDRWQPRRAYLERWLEGNGLKLSEERVQANAYLVMNLLTRSLKHLREPLSRDYLVERIEHGIENSAWRSVYREIGLGANSQRFAAKGGYVIGWTGKNTEQWDGQWIVPMSGLSPAPALTSVN